MRAQFGGMPPVRNARGAVATLFVDPVCGMTGASDLSIGHANYRGRGYDFCSHECQMKFQADPESFVAPRDVA